MLDKIHKTHRAGPLFSVRFCHLSMLKEKNLIGISRVNILYTLWLLPLAGRARRVKASTVETMRSPTLKTQIVTSASFHGIGIDSKTLNESRHVNVCQNGPILNT